MPSFCVVHQCNDKYGHDPDISFHKFPMKRPDLVEKWLAYAQRGSEWQPSKWSSICSRHFRDEDFSCSKDRRSLRRTAVPSVQCHRKDIVSKAKEMEPEKSKSLTIYNKARHPWQPPKQQPDDGDDDTQELDIVRPGRLKAPVKTSSPVTSKIICRLCGNCSAAVTTFTTNFEIYGMIQKCLPNMNIHKDDTMPKDMCRVCLKRLESFSRFIDQVMKTQNELQRKLRSDSQKQSNRPLNIKQEPVFRVKQEQADVFDSFLSDDMDLGGDDNCDHDHEHGGVGSPLNESVDQKLDLFDFPSLNTQDIINNCDIMEIVNLDDPFINIPDDDGNTTNLGDLPLTRKTPRSSSALDLLQAHMLSEEHNYANTMEECKNDWALKDSYKTEKIDSYEYFSDILNGKQAERDENCLLQNSAPANVITDGCVDVHEEAGLSSKPIIMSVSEIRKKSADLPGQAHAQVTAVDSFGSYSNPIAKPHNKPNIVVLNESIVKSSSAFQLLACSVCQLKFVSRQTLRHHEDSMGHGPPPLPMVSVPPGNLQDCGNPDGIHHEPQGEFFRPPVSVACTNSTPNMVAPVDYQRPANVSYALAGQHPDSTTFRKANEKPQINILEMQQTFINNMDIFGQRFPPNEITPINGVLSNDNAAVAEVAFKIPATPATLPSTTAQPVCPKSENRQPGKRLRDYPSTTMNLGKLLKHHKNSAATVAKKYAQLQRSYQQLQQKLHKLQDSPTTANRTYRRKLKQLPCNVCQQGFTSVYKLLHHKQLLLHHVSKPRHFAATCVGCEAFFRSRLALRNHMRYICQALPLRSVFRNPMKALKCRHCRMVTFTHWRLYRRHELNCRRRRTKRSKSVRAEGFNQKPSVGPLKIAKRGDAGDWHSCAICPKLFPNQNALNQHVITHSGERKHVCGLCPKEFKRRNGLMQHIKGYHLNLKPYTCPVCQHGYALKCDMLRCRHSVLRTGKRPNKVPTTESQEMPRSAYKKKR